MHDVGDTSLALLAFLGDGSTFDSGPNKARVRGARPSPAGVCSPTSRASVSGKHLGLDVNERALDLAAAWFDQVAAPTNGRHGYSKRGERSSRNAGDHVRRFPREAGEAMTGLALFCR